MRSIDRLFQYLQHLEISAYNFEKTCGIANGYLKKQTKGKGTIGSEILEKISSKYSDLSLTWLITGKGNMIIDGYAETLLPFPVLSESAVVYASKETIKSLKEKIATLETIITDKEKIISLLEQKQAGYHPPGDAGR